MLTREKVGFEYEIVAILFPWMKLDINQREGTD